jgi:hypothetical protein
LRILEGRRRRVEERREGLREVLARAAERLDAYTLELQRHGLEAAEREVRWLEELIATERSGRAPGNSAAAPGGATPPATSPSAGETTDDRGEDRGRAMPDTRSAHGTELASGGGFPPSETPERLERR